MNIGGFYSVHLGHIFYFMTKKVAVLVGGFSHEAEISFKSGDTALKNIDRNKFDPIKVSIIDDVWKAEVNGESFEVNKNDFSVQTSNEKIKFDAVFMAIHGTPGEDGKLQGYFDMLHIPYTTCGVLEASITFHKFYCNQLLKTKNILVADAILVTPHDTIDADAIINKLGLPCFAKPADGGSSFGVTKIKSREDVVSAVQKALAHGSGCLIESFIEGTEVTCGVFNLMGKMVTLPPTEVVTTNEFFDFDAKYNGMSEEITPARISDEMTKKIHEIITEVYYFLGLKGVCRIDFIIKNNQPYLIEVNTVPGLSAASIIPQQAAAYGLNLTELFSLMLEDALANKK